MKKLLTNLLPLLILFPLVQSCGAPASEEGTVTSDTVTTEQVNNQPPLDIVEDPVTEQDAITATAEATPEHIDAEKVPTPEILDVRPEAPKTRASSKPEKPAVDGTQVETPVEKPGPSTTTASTPLASENTPPPAAEIIEEPQKASPPGHEAWNTLLEQFVTSAGKVNYAAFKKEEAKLDDYLASLAKNAPTADWTRREGMAYWINAYNAATIKLILKNWPVKSIIDLHGGKPWDVKWIELGGETYSLNGIEHDILRPRYKDPGIHFAVNCAAVSCPPLPNKAFTPSNLTGLMGSRARAFIRNPAYNTIGETIAVSKIFDWYGEDFGNLRDYLNKYTETPIPEGKEIGFKEYDWALNKQ